MSTLDASLRDRLATVIGKENADTGARIIAEGGAEAAIEALAVHLPSPYGHLDAAQKQLRNRLRARARQLGDTRHPDGRHEIGRLVEQAAYEHWHRMLFARFLAENDLLIHPEMKVAVTLEECAELAASEGAVDGWELAGRYASRMLPQIFRPDDPLLALRLAIDDVKKLEALLDSLPASLFRASDSLGWCYQFWQAQREALVRRDHDKFGADEIPPVTQFFTEPYMVQFLLHNTLGAWWVGAGRTLPVEMPYLRVLDDGTPAAGTFDGWPRLARELRVLDPCCGSGHFLVGAFEILVAFRIAEEGLSAREACDAVLRDNLFGLEIDARCVQIAAFALAMAAWTHPEAGGYRPLAPMNVACSGLAISAKKEEWERLGGENARLRAGMARTWELFSDAPVLGSLIDPTRDPPDPMFVAGFEELRPLIRRALLREVDELAPEDHELATAAQGIADAGAMLSERYTLVVTNVPYLGHQQQHERLKSYIKDHHADARSDLGTALMDRSFRLTAAGGSQGTVSPQNWWFQPTYRAYRRSLLRSYRWSFCVALSEEAWVTFGDRGPRATLTVQSRTPPSGEAPIMMIDAQGDPTINAKLARICAGDVDWRTHTELLTNPDSRIAFEATGGRVLLSQYAQSLQGIKTGDDDRLSRCWWEVAGSGREWRLMRTSGGDGERGEGYLLAVNWSGNGRLVARRQGVAAWERRGVAVSQMRYLPASQYDGEFFDSNVAAVVPKDERHLTAILTFCMSEEYRNAVRAIDQAPKVTNATLVKVPFDLGRWTALAAARFPTGVPCPSSDNPTQWVFKGAPRGASSPLHVAVARLLGYAWPDQQPDALDAYADKDGIVCVPALRGERPAANRLTDLLAAAWGKDWHPQTLTDLLAAVGHTGTPEEWLRDAFFKQHCELFHHRPFIWHIWDGHRAGFSALVNYHRLDHEGLKSLTYSYLGDWIRTQEIEAKAGKSGAGDKLAKAKALQQRLSAILEGEAPLDVFVRWKPIEQQPIGWHPDLDDGVRLNIRPFLTVPDVGAKGAGVLRWKPNVTWGKDRGKNPPGSPWGEERDNDKHLTLAEKRAARGEA